MTDTAVVDGPGQEPPGQEPPGQELPGQELMVSVLDTFTFRAGDRALALPSGSRKLLAFLALRDRPATRHLVASTLWPGAPPQDAASRPTTAVTVTNFVTDFMNPPLGGL